MPFDVVTPKPRDLGGFFVQRLLPSHPHRALGPFVYFDHLGPSVMAAGHGVAVRPHPHIRLATVTYLFDGALTHRDSLGNDEVIRPGDVNWMTAGRGIVHSERTPAADLATPRAMHAIQSWVALPREHENDAPSFSHHDKATLPLIELPGVKMRLIAGNAWGERAPTPVLSPTWYLDAEFTCDRGAPATRLTLPAEHEQRAVYLVSGAISLDGVALEANTMAVLPSGAEVVLAASGAARVMLLGGAHLAEPRAVNWNFVSSSKEAIDAARRSWQTYPNAQFPQVPGESESIPLPA